MTNINLVIVGNATCAPCTIMKNQILDRMDELENIGATFDYIDLSEREDKDAFIQAHGLTSTPTTWIMKDAVIEKEITGYIDIDTLFDFVEEIKEGE